MNQRVELATPLYARSNTEAGISSIRTVDSGPPGPAPDPARAAARSASFSAAQTQRTSARPATADSPATTPPPPRRLASFPSSPRLKDTGPRLDAISTRPADSALMEGEVRASGPGAPGGVSAHEFVCRHRLRLRAQLHNAHPEGWRDTAL